MALPLLMEQAVLVQDFQALLVQPQVNRVVPIDILQVEEAQAIVRHPHQKEMEV